MSYWAVKTPTHALDYHISSFSSSGPSSGYKSISGAPAPQAANNCEVPISYTFISGFIYFFLIMSFCFI